MPVANLQCCRIASTPHDPIISCLDQIESIAAGAFASLPNLFFLYLHGNLFDVQQSEGKASKAKKSKGLGPGAVSCVEALRDLTQIKKLTLHGSPLVTRPPAPNAFVTCRDRQRALPIGMHGAFTAIRSCAGRDPGLPI